MNETGHHPNDTVSPRIIRKLKVEVGVLIRYLLEIHSFFSLKTVIKIYCLLPQHIKFQDYVEK